MSNTPKKTVKISENDLVDLIDNIVNEAVAIKKKEWINENKKSDKTSLLENKIAKLEKQFAELTKTK